MQHERAQRTQYFIQTFTRSKICGDLYAWPPLPAPSANAAVERAKELAGILSGVTAFACVQGQHQNDDPKPCILFSAGDIPEQADKAAS